MGVNIHKAGGDDAAFCVNFFAAASADLANGCDFTVIYGDIAGKRVAPGAVNNSSIADNHVMGMGHVRIPSDMLLGSRIG
jgi:hypothetical protein